MIIFVYTEIAYAQSDGPFPSLMAAASSQLWEVPGSSVWIEQHVRGGWYYENVRWTGHRWITTSWGIRLATVFRPVGVEEGRRVAA